VKRIGHHFLDVVSTRHVIRLIEKMLSLGLIVIDLP
jgi:hypothetical protein